MQTPSNDLAMPVRTAAALLLLTATAALAACSGAARAAEGEPMQPGRYTFDGSSQVTHILHDRQETTSHNLSGVMDVSPDGSVEIMSPGGSCTRTGSGTPPARVSMRCGAMTINIGPGAGTARLRTQQRYSQQSGCEEYVLDAQGRPTGQCARVQWRERYRTITIDVPLAVVRTSGG